MARKFKKNLAMKSTHNLKVENAVENDPDDSDDYDDINKHQSVNDDHPLNQNNSFSSDDNSEDENNFEDDSEEGEDSDPDDVLETLEGENGDSQIKKRKLSDVDDESSTSKKKKKRKSNVSADLKKPPTAQEVARLRETENLFHSSLFRLQIDEMLSELSIKKKRVNAFSDWFSLLKQSLTEMKSGKQYEITEQGWLKKLGVSVPIVQDPYRVKGVFNFQPPSSVYLIGSHAVECSLGPHLNVDIAIEMPSSCFQGSDHINNRYIRKRALYLCKIVAHLKSKGIVSSEEKSAPMFKLLRAANPLLPVAVVVPTGSLEGHANVHLHVTAMEETFKLSKLGPSKNSVRTNWFFNKKKDVDGKDPATPQHNASILSDLVTMRNEISKRDILHDLKNVKEGIILLKVWLRQRELDQGFSAFGSHLMTMLVVYLLRSRRVSSHMSSYQVARTAWNFLKESNWTVMGGGITLCDKPPAGAPTLSEFHEHYEVVFVDFTGYYNMAAHLDVSSFTRMKRESALAIQCLDNPAVNSFQVLFMKPAPFYRHFDHILCFHDMDSLLEMNEEIASSEEKLDLRDHPLRLATSLLSKFLQEGLGQRVSEWGIQASQNILWKITDTPSDAHGPLLIGMNMNPKQAFSILDKGPPADSPEAEKFRKFWGSKSELRRFQDGSISEAVVWLSDKGVTLSQRRVVNCLIAEYILQNKLGLNPKKSVAFLANQLEEVLRLTQVKPSSLSYGTGEEATLAVISALNRLQSELRTLSDLPLDISGVQGSSPVLRYTDVFPPLSTTHHAGKSITKPGEKCILLRTDERVLMAPSWIQPVEVVLQLALSGKWPEDVEAIRRVRAAFCIKIAQCLEAQCGLTAQAFPNCVDVLKDGFVFRLKIAYLREPALLRQTVMPDGLMKMVDNQAAQTLEKEIVHQPRLTSHLHGLHQQHPAFGPTTCLAKRWISSQMMRWTQFPEEVVELLVAHLFLAPEPHCAAAQPQSAFLRFLHLLSTTNWHLEPIILNFNNEITRDDVLDIERRFMSDRAQLPPLFIVTPSDKENSVWTKEAPNLIILARLALLASESLKVLKDCYLAEAPVSASTWKQIFRPSLDSYQVIIHLEDIMNPQRSQAIDAKVSKELHQLQPYQKISGEKIPVTGFSPVHHYLQELEDAYSDFALFFHDVYGGNVIGVVWKPQALEPKEFKVSHVGGRRLKDRDVKSIPQLVLNTEALIEDFYLLGQGLVKSIEVKDKSV